MRRNTIALKAATKSNTPESTFTSIETSELKGTSEDPSKYMVNYKSGSSEIVQQEINQETEEDWPDRETQARSWSHFLLGELVPPDPLQVVSDSSKISL